MNDDNENNATTPWYINKFPWYENDKHMYVSKRRDRPSKIMIAGATGSVIDVTFFFNEGWGWGYSWSCRMLVEGVNP